MKHLLPFFALISIIFSGCSPKVQSTAPAKPDWLGVKPYSSGYYVGIGHALKSGGNFIQTAKKSALEDLVSEIKVIVSSSSVLSLVDANNEFQERYEQIIQTEAADEIEEFELVDAWQDENHYWVYYRLSKERYRQIKAEKKRNAVTLSLDYYKKALEANRRGNKVQALSFHFQAFRALEKYLDEPIRVTVEDKEILLTNEIYASVQNILDQIILTVSPAEIVLNRRLNQSATPVIVSVSYKDNNTVAADLPLIAMFEKGAGDVFPNYKTDLEGQTKVLLTSIGSRELEQSLSIAVDVESLAASQNSSILSFITGSLNIPQSKVLLKVQRPVVYFTSDEKSLGLKSNYGHLANKLKNLLAKEGFEFSPEKRAADLWVDVKCDSEKGSVSGSIHVTYLTGTIKVTEVKDGREIYAGSFDRVKGYGLDFDRSSVDAYNKAMETLEKERMSEIIRTVLQ